MAKAPSEPICPADCCDVEHGDEETRQRAVLLRAGSQRDQAVVLAAEVIRLPNHIAAKEQGRSDTARKKDANENGRQDRYRSKAMRPVASEHGPVVPIKIEEAG